MPEGVAVLIALAVEKAVQLFQERISSLEDTMIAFLREKTAALSPRKPHFKITISSSSS
jgi:hypothetical protein